MSLFLEHGLGRVWVASPWLSLVVLLSLPSSSFSFLFLFADFSDSNFHRLDSIVNRIHRMIPQVPMPLLKSVLPKNFDGIGSAVWSPHNAISDLRRFFFTSISSIFVWISELTYKGRFLYQGFYPFRTSPDYHFWIGPYACKGPFDRICYRCYFCWTNSYSFLFLNYYIIILFYYLYYIYSLLGSSPTLEAFPFLFSLSVSLYSILFSVIHLSFSYFFCLSSLWLSLSSFWSSFFFFSTLESFLFFLKLPKFLSRSSISACILKYLEDRKSVV